MARPALDRGSGRTALVVGGTGPTGPDVVRGLLERGFETAIFHGGTHEVPLPPDVEHIHGDPHFPETIAEALGTRSFDVVIAQYGRLRHLTEHFKHKAGHVVAIGGLFSPLAPPGDARWGPLGRPAIVREDQRILQVEPSEERLGLRIAEAARALFAARDEGAFEATYISYPTLYGPRQPACPEWCIVRRIRDGRRSIILPDGGLRIDSRGFVHNVSAAPLLAIDDPARSDRKSYVVTDRDLYPTRQRVEFITRHLGANVELVDMPYHLATPAHPFYRHGPAHRASLGESIRQELGYTDHTDTASALAQTVDWLLSGAADIGEIERQLGDPFDYAYEDELLAWWRRVSAEAPARAGEAYAYSHIYRHPAKPGEAWRPRPPADHGRRDAAPRPGPDLSDA